MITLQPPRKRQSNAHPRLFQNVSVTLPANFLFSREEDQPRNTLKHANFASFSRDSRLSPLRLWFRPLGCVLAVLLSLSAAPAQGAGIEDPFEATYRDYNPGFKFPDRLAEEERKLSSEPGFHTLNLLPESSRADALVAAAKGKEAEGRFKEAIEVYQKVIDEYPDVLYRVSGWGIFVPVTSYCQLRILGMPKEHLEFYRTKYDSRAREAFEIARQRNSLEGIAQIRDNLLATSFGGPALMTLGCSALDKGHTLEALEYFETAWSTFPELRTQSPDLAMSIALCRKRLGRRRRIRRATRTTGIWMRPARPTGWRGRSGAPCGSAPPGACRAARFSTSGWAGPISAWPSGCAWSRGGRVTPCSPRAARAPTTCWRSG